MRESKSINRRRRVLAGAAILVAATLFAAPLLRAATIQLTILAQPSVTEQGLLVHLDIRNNGDAPARNLVPIVVFRGTEAIGTLAPSLEPASTNLQRIRLPLETPWKIQGAWPLFVRLSYSDVNQHPFEALHILAVPFGSAPPPEDVKLRLSGGRITTTGELALEADGPAGTRVNVTFVVPQGLAVVPEQAVLTLDRGTRRMAAFVTNAGATASSALPVFAVAEYNVGERHGTNIAAATVVIANDEAQEARQPGPAVVLLLLVVALGAVATWLLRRSRAS